MFYLQLAKKQPLYIGGIFPISGIKYVAPELAPGTLQCTLYSTSILPKCAGILTSDADVVTACATCGFTRYAIVAYFAV
jgi:hypothetical protein